MKTSEALHQTMFSMAMATSEKSRLGRDVIRGVSRLQKITEAATKWEKLQPAFDGISLSFCIEIAEAQECFEARSLHQRARLKFFNHLSADRSNRSIRPLVIHKTPR